MNSLTAIFLNILEERNFMLFLKFYDCDKEDLSNQEIDELAICARLARNYKGE